jgi:hypothetical protein
VSTVDRDLVARSRKFEDLEGVIERGLQTFVDVGTALAEIRDLKLYRHEYATFEIYCVRRWHFTDRRARQMIDAASTVRALEAIEPDEETGTVVPVPETESQARAIGPVLKSHGIEAAAQVMSQASESHRGKVTADGIVEASQHLGYVKTTARQSESTTTEHTVDPDTGEILDAPAERERAVLDYATDSDSYRAAVLRRDLIRHLRHMGPPEAMDPTEAAALDLDSTHIVLLHDRVVAINKWVKAFDDARKLPPLRVIHGGT